MIQITKAEFVQKYEDGAVFDVVSIKDRIYGKESNYPSNIPSKQRPRYRVVWADVT